MKIAYSSGYFADIGQHVFPMVKYRLVHDRLLSENVVREEDFLEPTPATDSEVLLVHTEDYVRKLKTGTLSLQEEIVLELPYSKELVDASWLGAGGTILACRNALADGRGINLAGGFHHAFPDHGEGFCVLNDVAIAIRVLQQDGSIGRAMVIDCDLHQGNGTAAIFKDEENVYTFSIHQENNYPLRKSSSDMDIGLADGTGDEEYLARLGENIPRLLDTFSPDLVLYLAGADPYEGDQLGGLRLTRDGLMNRDEMVLRSAGERKVAVAIVLAGGYAARLEDTVEIHFGTVKAAGKIR